MCQKREGCKPGGDLRRQSKSRAVGRAQERLEELSAHEAQLSVWKVEFKAAAQVQLKEREARLNEKESSVNAQSRDLAVRRTALSEKETAATDRLNKVAPSMNPSPFSTA